MSIQREASILSAAKARTRRGRSAGSAAGQQAVQQEVKRAQSHDRHDVRGVGEEWLAGDGEDGGDGVEREDDVGELDGDEAAKRMVAVGRPFSRTMKRSWRRLMGWRRVSHRSSGVFSGGVGLWLLRDEEADGGDQQDEGEDISDAVEAVEQGDAAGDEEAAHQHRACDSPEEDLGLVGGLDLEEAEEQQEDEEVVDRHRLFEHVAGEVLDGGGAEGMVDVDGEGEGGGDPEAGCDDGGAMMIAHQAVRSGGCFDGERRRTLRRAGAKRARWKPIQSPSGVGGTTLRCYRESRVSLRPG